MSTELEKAEQWSERGRRAVTLTPQARGLLEGPVPATLLRLAAPTVALMLLQDSRRAARVGTDGQLITLEEQDRGRWDAATRE